MYRCFLYLLFVVLIPVKSFAQVDYHLLIDNITTEKIQKHMDTLASETMEGRMTGQYGQKLAAQYISDQFKSYKLSPFYPDQEYPYLQEFNLYSYNLGHSAIYYQDKSYDASIFFSNNPLKDSIADQIVFAGYASDDELKDLDIQSESIFFFSKSVNESIQRAKNISEEYKLKNFIIGLPFGDDIDPDIFDSEITDLITFYELFYFYNYIVQDYKNEKAFSELKKNNVLIPDFTIQSKNDIRILFVPEEICKALFIDDKLELEEFKEIDHQDLSNIKPSQFSYTFNFNPQIQTLVSENVIGYIDCKTSDETIVIGAHYDHVGRNPDGSINYGADDNASGTTSVLLLSETLSKWAHNLDLTKDIVFITYSGEEIGLHGSQYFVNNPSVNLSNIDVVFNMDMIGRDKDDDPENLNRVYVLDWEGGKNYLKNINTLNDKYTHLIIDTNPGTQHRQLWTYGSDHYSFAEQNISSIAYFTGLHKDYHTSGDTPEKINYDKMQRIVQLILLNIVDISTQNQ